MTTPTPHGPPPAAAARLRGEPGGPLVVGAIALSACLAVNLVDPNVEGSLGWCPFKLATGGLDCPGCGVLRSTRALTRGDLLAAADHNLLWVVATPVLLVLLVGWWLAETGRRPRAPRLPQHAVGAVAVVTAVFWVVRNLPFGAWLHSGIT